MIPRASVLIPIHNKATTLPLTVDTVLRQSVSEVEVLLIGDGVTDDVRQVVGELTAADDRVRFLDFPKGPHHGERYRHDAILAARSDAIFYLCDDDLLLPDHVADLLDLLKDHTFVQSLNGLITARGSVRFYAADLGDPETVAFHLRDDVRFNSVSITGTAHSREFYEEVGDRWDTTPAGWWPDHHQFRKLMRHPSYRGATSSRMTALQFPTSSDGRDAWTAEQRLAELVPWHALVTAPGGQAEIDRRCHLGAIEQLGDDRRNLVWLREVRQQQARELATVRDASVAQARALAEAREELAARRAAIERLRARLAARKVVIERLRERLAKRKVVIERLRAQRQALRHSLNKRSGP